MLKIPFNSSNFTVLIWNNCFYIDANVTLIVLKQLLNGVIIPINSNQ